MTSNERVDTIILNGTGVNYSWHLPLLFSQDYAKVSSAKSLYLVSGGSTAFFARFAHEKGLMTWKKEDFLRWNQLVGKIYKNNLCNGLKRLYHLKFGSSKPMITEQEYYESWALAVGPAYFKLLFSDLPKNVRVPLWDVDKKEMVVAQPSDLRFAGVPAYKVNFAATAIPKIFPQIEINGSNYIDPMFCEEYGKNFLKWMKQVESEANNFENYNLLKDKSLANGKYIKICGNKDGKAQIRMDSLKFLFGITIKTYPANIHKSPDIPE